MNTRRAWLTRTRVGIVCAVHASGAGGPGRAGADAFYSRLLGLEEVSRPGNGGINLGLGTSFLGVYSLPEPGHVNHFCIGVDDFDPDAMAERLKQQGIQATVDRNPANRTSGGDQLYFTDPDKTRVQLGSNGYQG